MSGRVVHFEIPYDDGDRARRLLQGSVRLAAAGDARHGLHARRCPGPSGDSGPDRARLHQRRHAGARGERRARARSSSSTCRASTSAGDRSAASAAPPSSPKQPVGDMGFAAYVKDPEGNVVGLWETALEQLTAAPPRRAAGPRRTARPRGRTQADQEAELARLPGMAATGFHTADELNALLPGHAAGPARAHDHRARARPAGGRARRPAGAAGPQRLPARRHRRRPGRHRLRPGHPRAAARGRGRVHHDRAQDELPGHRPRGPDRHRRHQRARRADDAGLGRRGDQRRHRGRRSRCSAAPSRCSGRAETPARTLAASNPLVAAGPRRM